MKHFTKEQRYQIKAYLDCQKTITFIAQALNVSKSTISREIKRNSTKRGKYQSAHADMLANERKERFRHNKNSLKKSIINNQNTQNLNQIQMKINRRPRKNLDFQIHYKLFYKFEMEMLHLIVE